MVQGTLRTTSATTLCAVWMLFQAHSSAPSRAPNTQSPLRQPLSPLPACTHTTPACSSAPHSPACTHPACTAKTVCCAAPPECIPLKRTRTAQAPVVLVEWMFWRHCHGSPTKRRPAQCGQVCRRRYQECVRGARLPLSAADTACSRTANLSYHYYRQIC